MKTSAALLSLALFFAFPAAAQRGGSSSGGSHSSGSHASGGSSSHSTNYGSSSRAFSGGYSAPSSHAASSSGYSAATATHFYQASATASVAQAAGRYVGSTPAARAAMQRSFVRAPYVGSRMVQAGRPPQRTDTQPVITRHGPFIFSVPVLLPGQGFFFAFGHGFHHGFGHSFCGSFFGFGFGGFNSFNCFGNLFVGQFFWPWGLGYGSGYGLYNSLPYYGSALPAQPAAQSNDYEPPSAPGAYTPNALTPAEPEQPAAPKTVTLLALKDGAMYGVTDYWLDHGQLHYVASYGGENSVPLDRVDLDKTVELNSANGVGFVLRNAPSSPPPPAPLLLPLQPIPYPEIMF